MSAIQRWAPILITSLMAWSPISSQAMWDTSDADRFAGDLIQLGVPLVGLGMAYWQDDREGMRQLGKTWLTTAAATEALKYATQDSAWGTRPNGGTRSFPSGHTSSACAGAAFIGQRYGWRQGSVAMIPAAYVGWSRVDENVHHVRDVVVGCALGVVSAVYFTQPNPDLTLTPFVDRKVWGVQIRSAW